jgi:D-alanyl-lipoteichoic acid acyltransferase DltB (MBOAT superfamily)
MLFNSFEFLVFFPLVAALFFLLRRGQWLLLLTASCLFYGWFIPAYLAIMGAVIVVDYFAGLALERTPTTTRRRLFLGCSLVANIGLLAVFKYYNFAHENLSAAAEALGGHNPLPLLTMALPIGLSFHTFQALSYIMEVYSGRQRAERHFGRYALYVMFFPQMVAGPIERPQHILPQLRQWQPFDESRVASGLRRILWGLVKKVLIADRLAVCADAVFANPEAHHSWAAWLGLYAFAFQIYCDFSGYADIAVGTARVLGVELMENFRQPYFARDVREFWQRWHISLSTWFRDYVYLPLGGSRVSTLRTARNLVVVFLLSGLWHGAAWTYVVWGAWHGVGVLVVMGWRKLRARTAAAGGWRSAVGWLVTFHFVTLGWVFFRAHSWADAMAMLRALGDWSAPGKSAALGLDAPEAAIALAGLGVLLIGDAWSAFGRPGAWLAASPLRWPLYLAGGLALIFLSPFGGKQFIYFQF